MTIAVGAEAAVDETGGVCVRHRIRHLDCQLHGAAHVHRAAAHLRTQRLTLQDTRRRGRYAPSCSPASKSVVTFGCESPMSARAFSSSPARLAASGANSAWQHADRHGPAGAGIARAKQLAGTGRLEALEQVVVGDDP